MEIELVKNFLNKDGRIKSYPSKQSKLVPLLEYLSESFCIDTVYHEREVNEIILNKITFSDFVTLRRDLIDFGFLSRNKTGTKYRLMPKH